MTAKRAKVDPRRYSRLVVDGAKQAPSRGMLRAVGFAEADFGKPQVGIASTWANVTPCNMHIAELAREAAAGVDDAGAKSVLFNTITVSDGISMGSPGMRYSLVSREIIADSIETVVGAEGFDGFVAHRRLRQEHAGLRDGDGASGPPGGVRLRRHDSSGRASVATSCRSSRRSARTPRARSPMRSCSKWSERRFPVPAAAAGMYTANTMASAIEALGLSLPDSSAQEAVGDCQAGGLPASGRRRREACSRPGSAPREILTRKSFENAITVSDCARRLDQCRAASARHRQRGAHQVAARRFHADRQAACRCSPTCGRAVATRCRNWWQSAESSRS